MWRTTNEVESSSEFIDFLSEIGGETEIVISSTERTITILPTVVNLLEVLNHYFNNSTPEISYKIERKEDGRLLGSKNDEGYNIFLYWDNDKDFISSFPEYLTGRYYLHSEGNVFIAEDVNELTDLLKKKGKEGAQLWRQGLLLGTKVKK